MAKIKKVDDKLDEDLAHYRNTLRFLEANVPIQVLCLPKTLETILLNSDCVRVYDLINCDLSKIKGLGKSRLQILVSRLDQFFSISI